MRVEKVGDPKDIWVTCPHCEQMYYVDKSFYSKRFDDLLLFCPFCRKEFDKNDSLKTY